MGTCQRTDKLSPPANPGGPKTRKVSRGTCGRHHRNLARGTTPPPFRHSSGTHDPVAQEEAEPIVLLSVATSRAGNLATAGGERLAGSVHGHMPADRQTLSTRKSGGPKTRKVSRGTWEGSGSTAKFLEGSWVGSGGRPPPSLDVRSSLWGATSPRCGSRSSFRLVSRETPQKLPL